MAAAITNNPLKPSAAWTNGRELQRIKLPAFQDNPLFVLSAGTTSDSVEAYKSLRTQLVRAKVVRSMDAVAITSAAHADGKTLTTYNLACSCAQLNDMSVLLVDSDLRTSGLTKLIGTLPSLGLGDVLDDTTSFEQAIVATQLDNLYVLGAGRSKKSPAELFAGDRWAEFITWAKQHFRLVIIDSLPVRAVADFDLISAACDGIAIVVRALKTPREGIEEALRHVDAAKLIGVIWNGAQRPPKYYSYAYSTR